MSWSASLPLGHVDDVTASKVCELAAPIVELTGVSLMRIVGTERLGRVVAARHMLFVALWKAGFSLTEIGHLLHKDHTTVLAGLRKAMGPEEYRLAKIDRAILLARAS